jgi:hypothetical protein
VAVSLLTQLPENRLVAEVHTIEISDGGDAAMVAFFQVVETADQSHWNPSNHEKRDYIRALRLYPAKTGTSVRQSSYSSELLNPADGMATVLEHIDEIPLANEVCITDDDHCLLRLRQVTL